MYRPSSAASLARLSCLRVQDRAAPVMLGSKCLATLYLVDDLAHPHADRVLTAEPACVHAGLDLLEVALGGRQQFLTLVRAQPGQRLIAAGHQALARVVRRTEFEQIALIDQVNLKLPLLDHRPDRCALERRDPAD